MKNISVVYKRELSDELEKEIVAFLNTIGDDILIGENDDGSTVGAEKRRQIFACCNL